ncbi:DUF6197 family protein, partial [Staphylococcus aureus]
MNRKEVLTKARELITPPEKWTQGTSARDKEDVPTSADDPQAVCFCSIGAIAHI